MRRGEELEQEAINKAPRTR